MYSRSGTLIEWDGRSGTVGVVQWEWDTNRSGTVGVGQ